MDMQHIKTYQDKTLTLHYIMHLFRCHNFNIKDFFIFNPFDDLTCLHFLHLIVNFHKNITYHPKLQIPINNSLEFGRNHSPVTWALVSIWLRSAATPGV